MSELRSIGVVSIKMGAIGSGGAMGTSLTDVGKIYKDSAELSQEDPSITDFESEQDDDPVESVEKLGKKTIKFSIMDYTPATLAKFLGGEASGTPAVWGSPSTSAAIEQSVEITTNKVVISAARVRVRAKLNAKLSKTAIALIDVTMQILVPTDGVTEAVTIKAVV